MGKLPNTFSDITIEQYANVWPVLERLNHPLTSEEITEVWIDVLAFFTNETQDYYEILPFDKLQLLIAQCKFLTNPTDITEVNETITVNNHFYKGLTDITKGSYAQYSSIKTILSHDNSPQSYHKLLGCIYAPVKLYGNEYDMLVTGEDLKQAKVSQVLGLVFFYSKVFNRLIPIINDYLKIATMAASPHSEESLEKSMVGT